MFAAVVTLVFVAVGLDSPAQAAAADPLRSAQWSLSMIHADQAWQTSTGAGVVVAVIDSGVDLDHPDLKGKLVPGATFVGCPTDASCGNGDWGGTTTTDSTLDHENGHGTHVAGIIAAATHNGVGISGVAPDAKIMPIKVMKDNSGNSDDISRGIRWAVDHGARVINMSLGGQAGTDLLEPAAQSMTPAVNYALDHGVVVVAAGGNSAPYPFCSNPANIAGVLCVSAVGPDGAIASYSQGSSVNSNDVVAAPGGGGNTNACNDGVVSTFPSDSPFGGACGGDDYLVMSGTSMASPHVAGVAALLLAQCRTASETVAAIEDTAEVPSSAGLFGADAYGHGLIDAARAVASPGAKCKAPAIGQRSNLTPTALSVKQRGTSVRVRVSVANTSSAPAPATSGAVKVAGRLVGTVNVPALAAGESTTAVVKLRLKKGWRGSKIWSVTIDPADLIIETKPGDNRLKKRIRLR